MYTDVEVQSHEIDALLDDFRGCLKGIERLSVEEKRQRFNEIGRISQQVRTAKEAYILELRGVPVEDARVFKTELDEKMSQFKNLLTEYEWKKTEISREQLVGIAETVNDTNIDVDEMDRQQIVVYGDEVQDKTLESIHRMKRVVGETEQIGHEVVHRLDDQTEQMGRIHEKMNDVEYNLKRAQKTMKSIARNAASDRCVQVVCCLVVVLLIVVIALFATRPSSSGTKK
eukprot:GHVS01085486.1.p2 GENE.GHVS01085486.1~~GHVS01085486.1.p2  ORF type:complete len:229 (+),score=37.93 GHVS01085486.1:215-901(+)